MKVECYSVWKNEPLKRTGEVKKLKKSHRELCKAANVGHTVIQQQSTRHDCCSGTNVWLIIIHICYSTTHVNLHQVKMLPFFEHSKLQYFPLLIAFNHSDDTKTPIQIMFFQSLHAFFLFSTKSNIYCFDACKFPSSNLHPQVCSRCHFCSITMVSRLEQLHELVASKVNRMVC